MRLDKVGQFDKTVSNIGVPVTIQRGVPNRSEATLFGAIGAAGVEAHRGYHDARLENKLTNEIKSYLGEDDDEDPTRAEADFTTTAGKLQNGYSSGQISYNEFNERINKMTREAINRLPGRANTFRSIRQATLGDYSGQLEARKAASTRAATNRNTLMMMQAKADLKEKIAAEQANMDVETYRKHKHYAVSHAFDAHQEKTDAGVWSAHMRLAYGQEFNRIVKETLTRNNEVIPGPESLFEIERQFRDAQNAIHTASDTWAISTGNTNQAENIRKSTTQFVDDQLQAITDLSQDKYATSIINNMEKSYELGWSLLPGNSFYMWKNMPEFAKATLEARKDYIKAVGNLEPGTPEYERRLQAWRVANNSILSSPFVSEAEIANPTVFSDAMNERLEQYKQLGFNFPDMPKTAMPAITATTPESEEEHQRWANALAKLGDITNGSAMEFADFLKDNTFVEVIKDPAKQAVLKTNVATLLDRYINLYTKDFNAINEAIQSGESPSGLPFGPAFDMKYLSPKVALADPGYKIFVPKGVGYAPITTEGVDDNYRKGIQLLAQIIDKYPQLYPKGSQQTLAEMLDVGVEGELFQQIKDKVQGTKSTPVGKGVNEETLNEDLALDIIPEAFEEHLRVREGYEQQVYLDSLGKPTVGTGHLIRNNKTYVLENGDKIKGKDLQVGQRLDARFLDELLQENASDAYAAAQDQAEEAGITNDEFVNALASVNFQLGTAWNKAGPGGKGFVRTWAKIVNGDYKGAIANLKRSKWMKQTPVRVNDFIAALEVADGFVDELSKASRVEPGHYFLNGELVEIT